MRRVLVETIAQCAVCGDVAQASDLRQAETLAECDAYSVSMDEYVCVECCSAPATKYEEE